MREFKVSSSRTNLPRQRVGETRWTELKSKKVLRSLPFPIFLYAGRQRPPPSWGVERDLMTEEDDSKHPKIQIGPASAPQRLLQRDDKWFAFFPLPPEVRNQIHNLLAPIPQYVMVNYQPHECRWRQQNHIRYKQWIKGGIFYQQQYPVTRLWLVSRQFYHETKHISQSGWSCNTFGFKNDSVATKFVSHVSLQQANSIQNISFGTIDSAREVYSYTWGKLAGLGLITICEHWSSRVPHIEQLIKANRLRFGATFELDLKFKYTSNEDMNRIFLQKCALKSTYRARNYRLSGEERNLCSKEDWR
ncbi:uncharacterized protein EAF02_010949 [Botrytis sinoallii]|uniref:uncharacterized protein n=1 Tax=Botrytis sinoallii TaxID=1463999 RepID=UPI001901472A|nr:uncharacterized protein EAF02_010949 [Botrytis sinoallii]KAF7859501.1 hypothetical protein EAF02_010949 [Botrytis sinoallii]